MRRQREKERKGKNLFLRLGLFGRFGLVVLSYKKRKGMERGEKDIVCKTNLFHVEITCKFWAKRRKENEERGKMEKGKARFSPF